MTELTELPETWYVKVTEENREILSKWRFGNDSLLKLDTYYITGMCFSYYTRKLEKGHNPEENTKEFGKEITFEQFKKWVLKENVQYEHEVVHCTTQEEWDFVNSKLDNKFKLISSIWKNYKNKTCKCFNNNEYCYLDFYKLKNSLILTFQEWCDKFNYVNPFVLEEKWIPKIGDWIYADSNMGKNYPTQIVQVKEVRGDINSWCVKADFKKKHR